MPIRRFSLRLAHLAPLVSLVFLAGPLAAQVRRTTMLDYATGSEFEDYLRALQVAGLTQLYPWSIRSFSAREINHLAQADTAGPWSLAGRLAIDGARAGPLTTRTILNTSFPYGSNDGPLWAGRGFTAEVSGGAAATYGPLSIVVAPVAFIAQNAGFDLADNKLGLSERFQTSIGTGNVDYPQRFGDKAYGRIDPGNSTIRFDSKAITFGASTANEWIGPATEYPFLLSTNAPGFPHLFLGTGRPLNVWLARLHARAAWGKLAQSAYSPVSGTTHYTSSAMPGTERLATYLDIVALPRGMPGLEVGVGRFIHVPYRAGEPSADFWEKPFKVLFLKNEYAQGDSAGLDNQLASAFFRWVFPRAGFEIYGERGYEDQFYDRRDLVQRPDHEREYMLGFQKTLNARAGTLDVIKGELINYQYPATTVYLASHLTQGHTERGQLLGAGVGAKTGAASTLSWTRYSEKGRTTATFRRIVRAEGGQYLSYGVVSPKSTDVIIAAGLERMRFGKLMDIGAKVEAMQDFNRNFTTDVPNLNLGLTVRLKSW